MSTMKSLHRSDDPSAARLGPLIVKFSNFEDKTRVMKAAGTEGEVAHGEHHVMFGDVEKKEIRCSSSGTGFQHLPQWM